MLHILKLAVRETRRRAWYRSLRKREVWIDTSASVDRTVDLSGYNKVYANVYLANCRIGRFSYFAPDSRISNCSIGAFCSIGPQVRIGLGTHPVSWISTHPAFYSRKMQTTISLVDKQMYNESQHTAIGNDVWLGAGATILDGISIGDGAIVAAGAVTLRRMFLPTLLWREFHAPAP